MAQCKDGRIGITSLGVGGPVSSSGPPPSEPLEVVTEKVEPLLVDIDQGTVRRSTRLPCCTTCGAPC